MLTLTVADGPLPLHERIAAAVRRAISEASREAFAQPLAQSDSADTRDAPGTPGSAEADAVRSLLPEGPEPK
jgi:hypothetical protein